MRTHPPRTPPGGFSLVEVLIAVVVFSLGLGGLSLMMMTSVRGTVEAGNETMAAMQAATLAELILLNPSLTGHYINPTEATSDCLAPARCSTQEWAAGNLARWQAELERNLQHATGMVCRDSTPFDGQGGSPECVGSGNTVVKVFWAEQTHPEEADDGMRRSVMPIPD